MLFQIWTDARIDLIRSSPKNIYLKTSSSSFPRARSPDLTPEPDSGGTVGRQLLWLLVKPMQRLMASARLQFIDLTGLLVVTANLLGWYQSFHLQLYMAASKNKAFGRMESSQNKSVFQEAFSGISRLALCKENFPRQGLNPVTTQGTSLPPVHENTLNKAFFFFFLSFCHFLGRS